MTTEITSMGVYLLQAIVDIARVAIICGCVYGVFHLFKKGE